jgi:hypothetical protein
MIRYTGDGQFIEGIPARDLTDEEFQALSQDKQELVRRSGLYVVARKRTQKENS